jgi:uncharacterized protein (DUF305 family)
MMNAVVTRRLRRPATAVASAALAGGALVGGSVAVAAPAVAEAPAASDQTARYEVDFLKDMIDHHTMAIMMGQTCLEKAAHDDLVDMLVDSQSAQVEQMQEWLQDWYGNSYEPQLSTGDMQSMQRLERFTGADYEIRFLRSMIRHHWSALRESETCLDRAEHRDLRILCRTIHSTQLEEIAQMQTWLAEWYDRQGGRPARTA